MKRLPPLRRALTARFLVAAVLPLAVASTLAVTHLTRATRNEVGERNLLLARAIGGQIEVFLREPVAALGTLGAVLRAGVSGGDAHALLAAQVATSALFEAVLLLDPSGRVTEAAFRGGRPTTRREVLGLDLSHQGFFREALATGEPTWTDAFLSLTTGKVSLALCLRVDDRVLLGHVDADELWAFAQTLRLGHPGGRPVDIVVLDRRGTVVIHPDPELAHAQVNLRGMEPVARGLAGEGGTYRYRVNGDEYLGSSVWVRGPGWVVVVAEPAASAFAPVIEAAWLLGGALGGAALLAVWFALAQGRRVARPFAEFAAEARGVEAGTYRVGPANPRYREVQEFAAGFRRMTEAVREREASLRESRERFVRLFHGTNDAIFVQQLDPGGTGARLVEANDVACRLLGYDRESLAELSLADALAPSSRELVPVLLRDLRDHGAVLADLTLLGRDGREIPVEVNAHRFDLEGQETVLSAVRDTTVRKRLEAERQDLELRLSHSQRMEAVGTLAGGIAHDFNNLLHAIGGYAELAARDAVGVRGQRHLAQIRSAADRGTELVRGLLAFSRRGEPVRRSVDLNAEVTQTLELLARVVPRSIEIRAALAPDLWRVRGDPVLLAQVLVNLGTNARDAMPDGGELLVETGNASLSAGDPCLDPGAPPGPYVCLRVADTGIGMTPATVARIFEPFFTTKGVGEGTGLGLATAYGTVRDHGGWIRCQSALGRGTTFEVYLPAGAEVNAQAPPPAPLPRAEGGTETLLVVDDEEAVLDLAREGLEDLGYRVLVARDGEQAVAEFREHQGEIALVVLDLGLPRLGGDRCLEELRRLSPRVPVLVASGYSPTEQFDRMTRAGAQGFLAKPYRFDALARTVRALLEARDPSTPASPQGVE